MATVFLLEDEPNISLFVETVLTDAGHFVRTANNGITGLNTFSLCSKPDIVLLDLNLPGLSGGEIAKQMKASAEWKDIPVIIMSGCVEFSNNFPPRECYDEVLTKPFSLGNLVEMVNRLTGKDNIKTDALR